MMNATHGPTATLAGLVTITAWQYKVGCPAPEMAAWWLAASTAGGLLPDADHHSSSTARLWGPLTRIPAAALGKLAGGHRAATHDLTKGAPLLFGAALALGLVVPQIVEFAVGGMAGPIPDYARIIARLTAMLVIALIAGLFFIGAAAFIPGKWEGHGGPNFAMSWLTAFVVSSSYPAGLPWQVVLTVAGGIAVGVVAGIAGDAATISGVPWVPKREEISSGGVVTALKVKRDLHLLPEGFRIRTGSSAEKWLVRIPSLILCTWLGWRLMRDGYGFFGLQEPLLPGREYWAG